MTEKTPYDAHVHPRDSKRIQRIVRAVQWINHQMVPYKMRDHHLRTDDRDCSRHPLIFRGESQCYDECASTLYRNPEFIRALTQDKYSLDQVNFASFERGNVLISVANMLDDPTKIQPGECPSQLAEYRHQGGVSNCLDFSGNFVSALYFAVADHPGKDGRVIVVDTERLRRNMAMTKKKEGFLHKPLPEDTGSHLQDSVFLNHPNGKLDLKAAYTQDVVTVPAAMKPDLLWVLDHYLWINEITMYKMSSHMALRSRSADPVRRMEHLAATLRYSALEALTEHDIGMLSSKLNVVVLILYAGLPVISRLKYSRGEFSTLPDLDISEPVKHDENMTRFSAYSEDLISWRWRKDDFKENAYSGHFHEMAYHVKISTSLLRTGKDGKLSFLSPIERGDPRWMDFFRRFDV